jgi:hypothetical protein
MTAHRWEPWYLHGGTPRDFMEAERRRCALCGSIQELVETHLWMRKVSERWEPLVGRCPGKMHETPPKPEWLEPGYLNR